MPVKDANLAFGLSVIHHGERRISDIAAKVVFSRPLQLSVFAKITRPGDHCRSDEKLPSGIVATCGEGMDGIATAIWQRPDFLHVGVELGQRAQLVSLGGFSEHLQQLITRRPALVPFALNFCNSRDVGQHEVHMIIAAFRLKFCVFVGHHNPRMPTKDRQSFKTNQILAPGFFKADHRLHATKASPDDNYRVRVLLDRPTEASHPNSNHFAGNFVGESLLHGVRSHLGNQLNLVCRNLDKAAEQVADLRDASAAGSADDDALCFVLVVDLHRPSWLPAGNNSGLYLLHLRPCAHWH
mmetsp:Transcript_40048/g.74657  ORF Transcript_40048/g.74657 Transcript_40048/m.74657 type:complete len:297 (+) Transcript_40048:1075-1965(+)